GRHPSEALGALTFFKKVSLDAPGIAVTELFDIKPSEQTAAQMRNVRDAEQYSGEDKHQGHADKDRCQIFRPEPDRNDEKKQRVDFNFGKNGCERDQHRANARGGADKAVNG